jgi:peptidoglycan/xylan/chitin deacetylase (PgdA/CDA1 family)
MRVLLAFCVLGLLVLPAIAKAASPTLVTLTFDDGLADQYQARQIFSQDGLHGTFYVNSNNLGASSSFMTWDQATGLAADGNEIAGHTLDHVDLTTVSTAEAQRQICADRQALISHGFNPTDFAYPYGASNTTIEGLVSGCGYSSARRAWGLCPVGQLPPNCPDGGGGQYPIANTVPPRRIWEIPVASIRAEHTLSDIEASVTHAEANGGGWVVFLMHHVCDGCDPTNGGSISPSILSALSGWLAARPANGTYVRTMQDVISDHAPPSSSIACNSAACAPWYRGPVNVSLSAVDSGTAVTAIRYTTDGTDPTTSSPVYTGPFTVSTTTTVKYRAWDMQNNVEPVRSQVIQVDPTAPSSSIACNVSTCSSGWYTSAVNVSLSATDTGSGVAAIRYTTDGSDPTSSSPLYTSPFSVSGTTTVKYRAWDVAGNIEATKSQLIQVDSTAPSSSIACNGSSCASAWYTSVVSVSLSATDGGSGVAAIRYTTDGTDPTASSPLYSVPFSVSSTTTVKYRGWDVAGNAETTKSQLIQLDSAPPSSSIACNGDICSSAPYGSAVSVSLSAADAGSGVAAIRYTTDGTDPTTSSPLYTSPFTVSSTTTVKYRAWDVAGNVDATNTQLIQVATAPPDGTPPVSSITCNGSSCSSGWYASAVSVALSAIDDNSGVAAIRYTTDGSDPASSSPLYGGPFNVSSTTTVKYRAWDVAGNVEATNTQLIQVDSTAPSSSIFCDAVACSSGWYASAVNVSLLATDPGSGVAAIRYTTDGSDPTGSSPFYTSPFTVSSTTTVKYRAWDVAGNVEATKSRVVQVDTVPPSVAITSPANGATVSGNVKVVASPADGGSGVASVRFYVDGSLIATQTSSPWQVPWNTKKFSNAQHVLTVVATDRAGNTTTSAAVTVTVR